MPKNLKQGEEEEKGKAFHKLFTEDYKLQNVPKSLTLGYRFRVQCFPPTIWTERKGKIHKGFTIPRY